MENRKLYSNDNSGLFPFTKFHVFDPSSVKFWFNFHSTHERTPLESCGLGGVEGVDQGVCVETDRVPLRISDSFRFSPHFWYNHRSREPTLEATCLFLLLLLFLFFIERIYFFPPHFVFSVSLYSRPPSRHPFSMSPDFASCFALQEEERIRAARLLDTTRFDESTTVSVTLESILYIRIHVRVAIEELYTSGRQLHCFCVSPWRPRFLLFFSQTCY